MFAVTIAVAIVVVVSAACSLFEAVLYSVPPSHVESLAAAGKGSGRRLKRLREDVQRPIAAILSLNTIANTGGAAIAGAAAASAFGADRLAWFSAFFTLTILLFSEIIPKTAGVVFCRPLAPIIAAPLDLLVLVLRPLIWLTGTVTRLIARDREEPGASAQELVVMARLGRKSGSIEAHEAEVIANILALSTRTVHDLMTPRTVVQSLNVAQTLQDLRADVDSLTHTRIPLIDTSPDDVVGFVHRRDLLAAMAQGRWSATLGDLMRSVEFVPDDLPADRLLLSFMKQRHHMAVAMDEFGGVSGVVALEDVMEEVLGEEIVDEFDEAVDLRQLARQKRQALTERQDTPGRRSPKGGPKA